MEIHWIYFNIILISYYNSLFGKEIFVNINKDRLPVGTANIKIYNGDINVTGCPYLQNINKIVYLNLFDNITNNICNTTSDVAFYIFTYHTNIVSSMVMVENKPETLKRIRSISLKVPNQIVILSIQSDYVIFVVCEKDLINCQYGSVDQREIINNSNLTIYSACKGLIGTTQCITQKEFLSDMIDADSNSPILGSKIDVKYSNMEPKYGNITNCLNGGIITKDSETQRFMCICPNTRAFYNSGPRCELLQEEINEKQYLYVLPNTNKLLIEFSLSSPGHSENIEIFRIQLNDGFLLKYDISDVKHHLSVFNRTVSLDMPIDKMLVHVLIELSNETVTFRINEQVKVEKLSNFTPFLLDTFPFVVYGRSKNTDIKICFSNLKINQQIIDLYTPIYKTCVSEKCLLCKSNEHCLYEPFKSSGHVKCICKTGYSKSINTSTCLKSDAMTGQITNGQSLAISLNTNAIKLKYFKFKFRTIVNNGNLVKLSANPYTISIYISNKLINALIYNEISNKTKIIPINYYNVADGYWHAVYFELTSYSCQITLDEKIPFNSNSMFFDTDFVKNPTNDVSATSVTFGPLIDENVLNSTIMSCFDTLTIYDTSSEPEFNINLNGTMKEGCIKSSNCSTIVCNVNQKCVEKWQNNSCVCEDAFTDINGTCFFTKCILNPCKNNGICSYDTGLKNYKCKCLNGFSGNHCEIFITVANPTWWIILIIVLILLFILIFLLCFLCCFKKRSRRKEKADIDEIIENVVNYNDGAGETDYKGPPINFEMLNYINNSKTPSLKDYKERENSFKTEIYDTIKEDLMARKHFFDNHNNDLIIDHPLTYTFEGFDSDLESMSSLESFNNVEPVNVLPLPRKSSQSKYLNNLKNKA